MIRVLKIGGAVCAHKDTLDTLARAWKAQDGPWIIVHGGGPQLDVALRQEDRPVRRINGLRVTSPTGARIVQETLDQVGADLARGLAARGVPVRHVATAAGWFQAVPKTLPDGQTLGRVGTVTTCTPTMPKKGILVVTPVGHDAAGPLNINADEGALALAMALHADELVLATDVAHVLDASGRAIKALDPAAARQLIRSGAARGGMVPKLHAALQALDNGVCAVRIGLLSGTWDGTGTRILPALEATA